MKLPTFIVLLLSVVILASCSEIVDAVDDCVYNHRPLLFDGNLPEAEYYSNYSFSFRAEVKNEPQDDSFEYDFSYNGDLPEGIDINFNGRTVTFVGKPQHRGSYTFKIDVYVTHFNDDYNAEMCSRSASETYTLVVN